MAGSKVARWMAVGCLVVAAAVTGVAQGSGTHPNLSGEWRLNRDLSTEPREMAPSGRGREPGGEPPGRGRPEGGMPGRFGGGPSGGFGRGSEGDERKMREQMEGAQSLLRDAPVTMVVTYNDPKLSIAATDGRVRTLYPDKRKVKTSNGNADLQARWDGPRLVAETKFGSITVIETFALSESGDQLTVTAKIDAPSGGRGGRPNLELRRVYDRIREVDVPAK